MSSQLVTDFLFYLLRVKKTRSRGSARRGLIEGRDESGTL